MVDACCIQYTRQQKRVIPDTTRNTHAPNIAFKFRKILDSRFTLDIFDLSAHKIHRYELVVCSQYTRQRSSIYFVRWPRRTIYTPRIFSGVCTYVFRYYYF